MRINPSFTLLSFDRSRVSISFPFPLPISSPQPSSGQMIKMVIMVLNQINWRNVPMSCQIHFYRTSLSLRPDRKKKETCEKESRRALWISESLFSPFLLCDFSLKARKLGDGIIVCRFDLIKEKSKGNRARFAKLSSFLMLPFLSSTYLQRDLDERGSGRQDKRGDRSAPLIKSSFFLFEWRILLNKTKSGHQKTEPTPRMRREKWTLDPAQARRLP